MSSKSESCHWYSVVISSNDSAAGFEDEHLHMATFVLFSAIGHVWARLYHSFQAMHLSKFPCQFGWNFHRLWPFWLWMTWTVKLQQWLRSIGMAVPAWQTPWHGGELQHWLKDFFGPWLHGRQWLLLRSGLWASSSQLHEGANHMPALIFQLRFQIHHSESLSLQFPLRSTNFLLKHCFPIALSITWLGSQAGGLMFWPLTPDCFGFFSLACFFAASPSTLQLLVFVLVFTSLSPLFRAVKWMVSRFDCWWWENLWTHRLSAILPGHPASDSSCLRASQWLSISLSWPVLPCFV